MSGSVDERPSAFDMIAIRVQTEQYPLCMATTASVFVIYQGPQQSMFLFFCF